MKKEILTLLFWVGMLYTGYSQTDCYADNKVTAFIERLYNEGRIEAAKEYISNLEQLCEGKPPKVFLELKKLVFENHVKTITGVVSDEEGPIPGVTVTIRGTQKATETDFDGKYSIQVKKGTVLIFEHPNFHKKLYSVNNTQKLDVTLIPTFKTFTERVNGVSFKMVAVKGGSFNMGSNDGRADEKPVHKVRLSNYYIGETEVTQALWEAVMGSNPSGFKGKNNPVENVSWDDAQKFIKKLNSLTGKAYRLPTEAEWEYAARGGVKSKGYEYSGSNSIDEVAWYGYEKSGKKTHAVKQKKPNELGLYDMSGNVWEWCNDLYARDNYKVSPADNPQGSSSGFFRLLRGGSWNYYAINCRVTNRNYDDPFRSYYGFRVVYPLGKKRRKQK